MAIVFQHWDRVALTMATKISTAADLNSGYGAELRQPPFLGLSAYKLRKALLKRQPPLDVTEQALKTWISKYSASVGAPGPSVMASPAS